MRVSCPVGQLTMGPLFCSPSFADILLMVQKYREPLDKFSQGGRECPYR